MSALAQGYKKSGLTFLTSWSMLGTNSASTGSSSIIVWMMSSGRICPAAAAAATISSIAGLISAESALSVSRRLPLSRPVIAQRGLMEALYTSFLHLSHPTFDVSSHDVFPPAEYIDTNSSADLCSLLASMLELRKAPTVKISLDVWLMMPGSASWEPIILTPDRTMFIGNNSNHGRSMFSPFWISTITVIPGVTAHATCLMIGDLQSALPFVVTTM